jgi:hypothetical protein
MADRYWVGGTGTWDGTTTTNWASTSGGAGGASVPTAADNAIFDAGSDAGGIFTVTLSTTARVCNNITASALDFTMTLAGTVGLTVSGNLSFPASNFTRTWTGGLTFNATTTGKTITTNGVTFAGNITFNGAGGAWQLQDNLTIANNRTVTLTAGSLDLNNKVLSTGLFASSNANTRVLAFGTSGSISITDSGNNSTLIDFGTATNLSLTGTVSFVVVNYTAGNNRTIDLGSTAAGYFTEANTLNLYTGGYPTTAVAGSIVIPGTAAATDNYTLLGVYKNIDFTNSGSASAIQIKSNSVLTIYGNFKLATGMTEAGNNTPYTFASTSTGKTVNFNGVSTAGVITFNGVGGGWTLAADLNLTGTNNTLTLTNGTFNASSYSVTTERFSMAAGTTLSMGSGTWTLSGTNAIWTATAGATLNKNTANIVLSNTSIGARTFAGGGYTYNNLTIGGASGSSTLTISGSNTFNVISSTKTVPHTILFTAGTTTTVSNWGASGTAGNLVTIGSTTTSAATLTKAGGGIIAGVNYLSISYSTATPANTWYTGANSTDGGNNSGWLFKNGSGGNFALML